MQRRSFADLGPGHILSNLGLISTFRIKTRDLEGSCFGERDKILHKPLLTSLTDAVPHALLDTYGKWPEKVEPPRV